MSVPARAAAVPAPQRRRRDQAGAPRSERWLPFATLAGLVVLWQLLSLVAGDNKGGEANVPAIPEVAGAAKKLAYYWQGGLGVPRVDDGGATTWRGAGLAFVHSSAMTGLRMSAGFLLGVLVGLVVAVLVSWSSIARRMFALPAHLARMLPLLAMVPLFGIWFGNDDSGAILFVAFTVFVLVFAVAVNAIGNVPAYYSQYARSLGASPIRAYLRVVLPAALPQVRTGLVLALGFAWSAAISAEFNGQQVGLGHIADAAEYFSRTDTLALIAVIVIAYASLSFLAMRRLMAWATRWAE